MKALVIGLLLWVVSQPLFAETSSSPDALGWLKKSAEAASRLNYRGTFVYRYGDQVETSRVIHAVDESGERGKVEILDGPPREILWIDGEIQCYLPDGRVLTLEKRDPRIAFPAPSPGQLHAIAESYVVRTGERDRVAGIDCQTLTLEPKDRLRYKRKFCADLSSGLLLKATAYDENGGTVEQFAFTELSIGSPIDEALLQSRLHAATLGWRHEKLTLLEAQAPDAGWDVGSLPRGFKKVAQMTWLMGGNHGPVMHLVFSDGMAAVSVFIEQNSGNAGPVRALQRRGALTVYTKAHGDRMITVVGETPAAIVIRIGDSVSYRENKTRRKRRRGHGDHGRSHDHRVVISVSVSASERESDEH